MSANSRRVHADWADISFDILDKIKQNLVSKESDANGQEFVKSARLVNKHWNFWAGSAIRCIKIPASSRLCTFARVCSRSILCPARMSRSRIKWMSSGDDVVRQQRGGYFASLGSIDVLKTVAAKFAGVETLTMSHCLPNPHLAIPLLKNMGRLRRIVLNSGNTKDVSLSWLLSVEGLRCLCLHPVSRAHATLYPYNSIGALTQLESLELEVDALHCNIFDTMTWLGGVQHLERLHLGSSWLPADPGMNWGITHLTSLTDLSLCGCKLTNVRLMQLSALQSLRSLTLVRCPLQPLNALTCLHSLPPLSTLAIQECYDKSLDYEVLGALTSLHALSVAGTWGKPNCGYSSWNVALTCLTRLEVHVRDSEWRFSPDFANWSSLPGLKYLGIKTHAPLPAEQLDILKGRFPAAQLVMSHRHDMWL